MGRLSSVPMRPGGKPGPQMTKKADLAADKKAGRKENGVMDKKLDKRRGIKD